MEIKKTGKLFSFCCMAPGIIKNRNIKEIKNLEKIGLNIGLLFQIADDLIDHDVPSKMAGKKTKKDEKQGKATLISLLGYKNTIKYRDKIKTKTISDLKKYGKSSRNIIETLDYILKRNK